MQVQVTPQSRIELQRGDITKQKVDVIVNAANSALCGGGGVDGAIHRAGGPTILAECRQFKGGCPTGEVVMTGAGELPCKRIAHAVGPVWSGGGKSEEALLESVYRNALILVTEERHSSVAFPSISTGAYRFPIDKASKIAVETCTNFLQSEETTIQLVRLVVFSKSDLRFYESCFHSR